MPGICPMCGRPTNGPCECEEILRVPPKHQRGALPVLPDLKGRTITGYATGAAGDHLQMLTLTLDDGSWVELKASTYEGWIDIERRTGAAS